MSSIMCMNRVGRPKYRSHDTDLISQSDDDKLAGGCVLLQMVVNTEWGAFGDKEEIEFVRNEFDRQLDQQSLNPQHQL